MRHVHIAISAVFLAVLLNGCTSTTYKEYVGGREVKGQGGTRELIEGVEVWENGAPNRPFRVIGIIDDHRGGGVIPRMSRLSDIAKKTKEAGGDAVIVYQEGSEIAGFISDSYSSTTGSANVYGSRVGGSASTSTSGYSVPVTRLDTKAAVIKYAK